MLAVTFLLSFSAFSYPAIGRSRARGAQDLRLHGNGGQERAGRRIRDRLGRFGFRRVRSGALHHARTEKQTHAQQHGRAEDERENVFFHVFVLLSQAVGIGSICVLEVLASTVPTCFHTSRTSLAAYFSRFAVWTASAVT